MQNNKPTMLRGFIHRPVVEVLIGAFMISFSAVWVTLADVPATTSAFYRLFFGSIFLLAATLYTGEFRNIHNFKVGPYALCGMVFALDLLCWHRSVLYIGPGLSTILGNFQVFLMAACGFFFFKEKLKIRFLLSLPLAVGGLLLIVGFDWSRLSADYQAGIVFGLLTALCYTAFLLLLRRIQSAKEVSTHFTPLLFVSMFGALSLTAQLMYTDTSFAIPTVESGIYLVLLGLLSQAIGWVLIANAMPKIHASFTGLILLLQPSLSFLWDVLFFSRPTTTQHWIGVSITLAAIYLGLTGSSRK